MPLLGRNGVTPLLKKGNHTVRAEARPRRPPSEIDTDASPISLSEESSDAESVHEEINGRPAKRAKIEEDNEDNSRNPRKTKWKGLRETETKQQTESAGADSQNDDKLATFDELHSSNSSMHKKIMYHYRPTFQTPNIHTTAAAKKKTKKLTVKETADVPAKNAFRIPDDDSGAVPHGRSKGFNAPPLEKARNGSKSKSTFLVPEAVQGPIPSSEPFSLPPSSSKHSSPSLTPNDTALQTREARLEPPYAISLASQSSSPEPYIGSIEEAHCPMCKAEVSKAFLDSFSGGRALRLKEAMDFCILHKAQNAQSSWANARYPMVDWDTFDKRLRKFNARLSDILARRQPSHFRTELAGRVASGRGRNALRNPEAEGEAGLRAVTGYYGAKGAQKMMEHITKKFAGKIRKVATEDELFTEVGVGGFIQAVLVPELAVSLVMEDYGTSDESRAREILQESTEMGNLVHAEEEEDKVEHVAEDDRVLVDRPPIKEDAVKPKKTRGSRRKGKG